ncbi:MAG: LemA family protein [Bacteroidota bacterium]
MILLLCAAALAVGGTLLFASYLFALRRTALEAFLRLEAELDRRYNLGLKLIRSTQDYLPADADALEALIDARGTATQIALDAFLRPECPALVNDLTAADEAYGRALSDYAERLRTLPTASDPEIGKLLQTLAQTPDRVRPAEDAYNDAADAYNGLRMALPNLLATASLPAHLPAFQFRPAPLRVLVPVSVAKAA